MNILHDMSNTKTNTKANLKHNIPVKASSESIVGKNSGTAKTVVEVNQVIKGEIVDLRANEAKIKLPNSEIITAKLASSVDLYIGQYVSFTVEELSDKILLKPLTTNQNQTLLKALIAAGLPVNDKNTAIVNELLKNHMPIDKQTITTLLRQSLMFKDASLETLAFMNKNNMPINENSIIQFENYKNHEHKIINIVNTLSDDISALISNASDISTEDDLFYFNQKLIDILTDKPDTTYEKPQQHAAVSDNSNYSTTYTDSSLDPITKENMSGNITSEITPNNIAKEVTPTNITNEIKSDNIIKETVNAAGQPEIINPHIFSDNHESSVASPVRHNEYAQTAPDTFELLKFTKEDRASLVQLLEEFDLPKTLKASILDNTAHIKEVFDIIDNCKSIAYKQEPSLLKNFDIPIINDLIKTCHNLNLTENSIDTFMNYQERTSLATTLENFNIPTELKDMIIMGNATPNDILSFLQNAPSPKNKTAIKSLTDNKEYLKLLKEEIRNQFTLTPKSVAKEKEVDNYYNKIYNRLENISSFVKEMGMHENPTAKTADNLKSNIDFMKNLNEMFAYVQLPIKLKDKNLHSELYVYTNKKSLKKNNNNISALLHLDMDYLGSVDINITLTNKNIVAKFYLEDKASQDVLKDNMDNLKNALTKRGFTLNSEVLNREKEVDIISDFIEKGSPSSSLSRYSFDVRA